MVCLLMVRHPNFLVPRHWTIPRHHTETRLRYIHLVLIEVKL
jgi:hypothetical protein